MTIARTDDDLILVLGGTGKTGRRVVDRLRATGHAVRVGSRAATPPFNWDDRSTWSAALDGARRAYVSYQPDLAVPGALPTVQAFFAQAAASGVEHLVLLSGRGEIEAEEAEHALRDCGVDWTILRCSWFSQNFSEGFLHGSILDGEVALPVDGVVEPFVDADDIADVAVAALTQPGHSRKLYELTGPRAISFAEAVASIGRACGREIRMRQITFAAFRDDLLAAQVPGPVVSLILYLFTTVLDGRNARVTDGVQQALGRPARDFDDYAWRTAPSNIWSPW